MVLSTIRISWYRDLFCCSRWFSKTRASSEDGNRRVTSMAENSRLYCVDKYQECGKRYAFPLLTREESVTVPAASGSCDWCHGVLAERPRSPTVLLLVPGRVM